ncbi:MAG: hypothetical protein IAG13_16970 [Deltaproteobacteria bacterium]|nr:hypothetical protein [Nannocystaceae bacterium]
MLDAYPTAAAYLAGLPAGLDSHPECLAYEAHEGARRQLLERGTGVLDEPLAAVLRTQGSDRWIPDVHGLVAQMMLVDALGEPAYLRWIYDEARRLYDRPFLRHLMRLLSPSLVLMGGASRWGALHKGSRLSALPLHKSGPRVTGGITLEYPVGLFPPAFCRALAETFRAACDLAHASAATARLVEHGSTRSSFEIGWDR